MLLSIQVILGPWAKVQDEAPAPAPSPQAKQGVVLALCKVNGSHSQEELTAWVIHRVGISGGHWAGCLCPGQSKHERLWAVEGPWSSCPSCPLLETDCFKYCDHLVLLMVFYGLRSHLGFLGRPNNSKEIMYSSIFWSRWGLSLSLGHWPLRGYWCLRSWRPSLETGKSSLHSGPQQGTGKFSRAYRCMAPIHPSPSHIWKRKSSFAATWPVETRGNGPVISKYRPLNIIAEDWASTVITGSYPGKNETVSVHIMALYIEGWSRSSSCNCCSI